MKKILLIAAVAIAFMACESNGASVPSKDKKAAEKATISVVNQIGADAATVEKSLTDAGFEKVPAELIPEWEEAPKRMKGKVNKAKAAYTEDLFIYGIDVESLNSEDQGVSAMNKALKKGTIIFAYAMYYDGKLLGVETVIYIKAAKGASKIYTDSSDGLFATIPADALLSEWTGLIDEKESTDHAAFVAAVAAAEGAIEAEEQAYAITSASYDGFFYMGAWYFPSDADKEEMAKEGLDAYALAQFLVVDVAYIME